MIKKGDPDAIHNTPELYKAANDKRNEVRRDTISTARAGTHTGKKGEPYKPLTLVEFDSALDSSDPWDWAIQDIAFAK